MLRAAAPMPPPTPSPPAPASGIRVAVTVDVEGDFGTDALRGVDTVMPALLDLFEELSVRATLFLVGDVARRRPEMVREASARGHLIGSHSMTHVPLRRATRAVRRAELADSRALLQDTSGQPVDGFRAPFFDVPGDLGPLLEESGYAWSSSKAPFSFVSPYRQLLGTRRPHHLAGSRIVEFPIPGIFGLPIPDGLAYRRLFHPVTALPTRPPRVFYLHPYELLPTTEQFGFSPWLHPLLTLRQGGWAKQHLRALLARWKSKGAAFEPPDPRNAFE